MFGPPKEDIFLTTFYGHLTHIITSYNLSHVGPLWAAVEDLKNVKDVFRSSKFFEQLNF